MSRHQERPILKQQEQIVSVIQLQHCCRQINPPKKEENEKKEGQAA